MERNDRRIESRGIVIESRGKSIELSGADIEARGGGLAPLYDFHGLFAGTVAEHRFATCAARDRPGPGFHNAVLATKAAAAGTAAGRTDWKSVLRVGHRRSDRLTV